MVVTVGIILVPVSSLALALTLRLALALALALAALRLALCSACTVRCETSSKRTVLGATRIWQLGYCLSARTFYKEDGETMLGALTAP